MRIKFFIRKPHGKAQMGTLDFMKRESKSGEFRYQGQGKSN